MELRGKRRKRHRPGDEWADHVFSCGERGNDGPIHADDLELVRWRSAGESLVCRVAWQQEDEPRTGGGDGYAPTMGPRETTYQSRWDASEVNIVDEVEVDGCLSPTC